MLIYITMCLLLTRWSVLSFLDESGNFVYINNYKMDFVSSNFKEIKTLSQMLGDTLSSKFYLNLNALNQVSFGFIPALT